ncbi:MAG TPA: hypothetical protein VGQ82_07465 [Chthoniobacterales bacterium]|nr:hypothetical protein [Chthoniobacterales bacterium]
MIAGILLLFLGIARRVHPAYWSYAAVSVLFDLSWSTLEGVPRYLSVSFYVVLASLAERAKWTYEPLLALSSALLALCTVAFANAYQMT